MNLLSEKKNAGDIVNIECDMIGKYIERFISKPVKRTGSMTESFFTRKRISIRGSIMFHRIEEALEDLKQGKVVIVCDDENRENEGDFIALAEYITPETINFMITHGRGLVCIPITEGYAERLQLEPMVAHNTDSHHTAFTVSTDHVSTTTGISAHRTCNYDTRNVKSCIKRC